MSKLSTNWEQIGDHARGPLVAVRFSGGYPPGSAGNEFARAMIEFLRSALAETHASGVVLDLTALDYVSGDAIGELAMPLLVEGKSFRPSAIVATGATARALEPLLAPNFLMGVAGIKLVHTTQEAVAHVEEALARGVRTFDPEAASRKRASVDPASTVTTETIASNDPKAFPALIRLLNDRDRFVQRMAAVQLGFLGDRTAIEPLLEVFEKTPHLYLRKEILCTLDILGHPTNALRERIDVFDPIALVLSWIDGPPKMEPDGRIWTTLVANFQREGAAASDRLADIIQQLVHDRSEKIEVALAALSVDVLLTPKLEAVLTAFVSAPSSGYRIDSRMIEGVKAILEKPKRMKAAILNADE